MGGWGMKHEARPRRSERDDICRYFPGKTGARRVNPWTPLHANLRLEKVRTPGHSRVPLHKNYLSVCSMAVRTPRDVTLYCREAQKKKGLRPPWILRAGPWRMRPAPMDPPRLALENAPGPQGSSRWGKTQGRSIIAESLQGVPKTLVWACA